MLLTVDIRAPNVVLQDHTSDKVAVRDTDLDIIELHP